MIYGETSKLMRQAVCTRGLHSLLEILNVLFSLEELIALQAYNSVLYYSVFCLPTNKFGSFQASFQCFILCLNICSQFLLTHHLFKCCHVVLHLHFKYNMLNRVIDLFWVRSYQMYHRAIIAYLCIYNLKYCHL